MDITTCPKKLIRKFYKNKKYQISYNVHIKLLNENHSPLNIIREIK